MAKSDVGGKWITLEGGRHVFVKDGQSVSEAMNEYNKNKSTDKFEENKKQENQDENKKKKDEIEKKIEKLKKEKQEYEDKIEALQEQYDNEDNIPDYQLDQLDAWVEESEDCDYNIEKLEKQLKDLGESNNDIPDVQGPKVKNLDQKVDEFMNQDKSEEQGEADDDLKDVAMDAWYDGDIEKNELVNDYFGGDEHKANQALFDHFNEQDNGTMTETAMQAYKNGDISYDDLVRDYFYGDKKIAADYIQNTKADSTGTLAKDKSDQKLINQAYLENSETAKPKSKYSEEELYGVYETQDASDVYAYLSGNEKEELRELTGKSTNSVEELNRIHKLEEKAAERYLDDYDDEFSQLDENYYSNMNKNDYEELAVKNVTDSDGFNTEYTMYKTPERKYKTVFGDRDLYGPDDDADMEFDTLEEATEWFNNYKGFDEDNFTNDRIYKNSGLDRTTIEIANNVDQNYPEIAKKVEDNYNASLKQAAEELGYNVNTNNAREFMEIRKRAEEIRFNKELTNDFYNNNSKNVIQQGKENTKAASKNAKQRIADTIGKKSETKKWSDQSYWNGNGKNQDFVDKIDNMSDQELIEHGVNKGLINRYRDESRKYFRFFNDGDLPHKTTRSGKTYGKAHFKLPYNSEERQYWNEVYGRDMEDRINEILDEMKKKFK